ncbi:MULTISPECIES: PBP1A family penicillin-binding protein [unclassified Paenibacillus]|uniref:transglycosylase domain-containing protein n=1 Tax=unclassified Paenibacillus TaxID=185978 RepID=UPI0024771B5D|nr:MULTISPECIES: PBP1A family penicillin-binding protein [unclassified Paenibacillus]MDH6431466.1 1A family penicillin-binding protein [Paenibacillus sp. PastH-4]MDH6447524.1 1A family penicillin-binding protein [Paenibacillus sp. PastF-4]MDH6531679.1 1A family penicillin-binding protein [Paenibacillus sp. PastH-3]
MTRESTNPPKRKSRFRRLFRLLAALIILFVLTTGALLGYLYQKDLPPISDDVRSKLFDSRGNVLATFTSDGRSREPVKLSQISPLLIEATLAVEDRKFYEHSGFDLKGMARAVLVNLEEGNRSQGASTLTQQLARNLYLSHEKTWTRKAKEAVYTMQLEMKYSKDEILNMYLNNIYYGHGAYGIEAASRMYFGKSAADLDLAESTMLAGIPKGPTYYSPYNHMDNAKKRQRIILTVMANLGNITQEEAGQAVQENLNFKPQGQKDTLVAAPYFRDYIRNLAIESLHISNDELEQGGLNVYTTLDPDMQHAAENAVDKEMDQTSDLETALVSIDPRTGYIKAMVGGKNYRTNQYNHALATTRQPGSSFKPIMYLAALSSKEMTGLSVFNSQPTMFHYDNNRKTYQPRNFGDKYLGEINMRQAIAASDNIYAVNTIMKIGADKVSEMAAKMGIDSPLQSVPSLALGTSPISPLEMAAAFAVIGNSGQKMPTTAILKITDSNGMVLYEAPQPKGVTVVEPSATYVLTRLMEGVFETGGTGNRVASIIKRPVAGKTGTTDTDGWMVGFTPELSTAVWVGYDKGRDIATTDGRRAAPIFAQFTEKALENVPPKIFPIPDGVVSVYVNPQSGKLATAACPDKELETFISGTEPTEYCELHGTGAAPAVDDTQSKVDPAEENRSLWKNIKRWWLN